MFFQKIVGDPMWCSLDHPRDVFQNVQWHYMVSNANFHMASNRHPFTYNSKLWNAFMLVILSLAYSSQNTNIHMTIPYGRASPLEIERRTLWSHFDSGLVVVTFILSETEADKCWLAVLRLSMTEDCMMQSGLKVIHIMVTHAVLYHC